MDTACSVVSAAARPQGCTITIKFVMRDADTSTLYCTQFTTLYYRGCSLGDVQHSGDSSDLALPLPLPPPVDSTAASPMFTRTIAIGPLEAHVYTECSRIWNPIHTDRAVALAAGLPDLILHGTSTMAKVASTLVHLFSDNDPSRVQRIATRALKANVFMPCTLTLRVFAAEHKDAQITVLWDVVNADQRQVITGGVFVCATAGTSRPAAEPPQSRL